MVINLAFLREGKPENYEEEIDFSNLELNNLSINKITNCFVKCEVATYDSLIRLKVKVSYKVIAVCAYSLEEFEYKNSINDETDIYEEDDSPDIEIKDNKLYLDEYVLALILSSLPKRLIKKGAKLPESGDGYRVLSEEELIEEKSKKKNSAFDVLDSLEL